jgi:hypothetical protein
MDMTSVLFCSFSRTACFDQYQTIFEFSYYLYFDTLLRYILIKIDTVAFSLFISPFILIPWLRSILNGRYIWAILFSVNVSVDTVALGLWRSCGITAQGLLA